MTYKLSFTGEEIDEKLGKINEFENSINNIEKNISNIENFIDNIEEDIDYNVKNSINNVEEDVNNIKNSINNVESSIDSVKKDMDNVESSIDNVKNSINNVEEDVNNIKKDIDSIEQQSITSYMSAFTSNESEGWKVIKSSNFTKEEEPKEFINCFNLLNCYKDTSKSSNISGLGDVWYFTRTKTPYPLKNAVVTVNPRYYQGIVLDAKITNNCLVDYKVCYLGSNPSSEPVTHGISIQGERATPPDTPKLDVGVLSQRAEAIAVAQSYIDARDKGRAFSYGENFIGYANSTVLNDSKGAARLECDAFVFLVMSGIPYNQSPYVNTSKNATYNFEDLEVNPNGYTWCLPWKEVPDSQTYKRKITTTGWQNFFCWNNGMVFKNREHAEAGDIVIFTLPPEKENLPKYNFFDRITHVGVVNRRLVNGEEELYIYHVGDSENGTRSTLNYEPLQDAIDRRCTWDEVYFARPDYTVNKGVWI